MTNNPISSISEITMIQKTFAKVNRSESGSAKFIASTSAVDRYGDVVDQSSWKLDNYKSNAVILLNHRQDMLPIGRATNVEIVNGQLEIDVEFDMDDELGKQVARKVEKGFLSAVSVGFSPKKAMTRAELPEDHPAYTKEAGMYFQENELLEVSVVTIPANAEAIAKGMTIDELHIKMMIRRAVKAEVLAMPTETMGQLKHILEIEETANTFVVTYAKNPEAEEIDEVEEVEEVEEAYGEHDDDDDDEDKTKQLLTYLLTV